MPTQFYTGSFQYERDVDLSIVIGKFRVLTDVVDAAPSVLGTAYDGCIGVVLPPACRACFAITPRHYLWTGIQATGENPQQHKVPVNLLTNLTACLTALEASGINPCITYKGESFRNIHRAV